MHPLHEAWNRHRTENPRSRTADVARALGVPEGALFASKVGAGVTRLRPDWPALFDGLRGVGPVMCLTRNGHVVHERRGEMLEVRAEGPVGGVFGPDIDLRLFLSRWGGVFAGPVETRTGHLDSLQIFDKNGVPALKIYRESEDPAAWEALVAALTDADQTPGWEPEPPTPPAVDAPDATIDVMGLRDAWDALRDTHDFFGMLRRLAVGREQALRLAGEPRVTRVATSSLEGLLRAIADDGLSCMVFVSSPGCVQIHSGPLHRVAVAGGWLNVLDPEFNLHIDTAGVASTWIVRKPTSYGLVTSLEVFDADGGLLLQVFGKRTEGTEQSDAWRALLEDVGRAHPLAVVGEA